VNAVTPAQTHGQIGKEDEDLRSDHPEAGGKEELLLPPTPLKKSELSGATRPGALKIERSERRAQARDSRSIAPAKRSERRAHELDPRNIYTANPHCYLPQLSFTLSSWLVYFQKEKKRRKPEVKIVTLQINNNYCM
jgi:hypothetical protein